MNTDPDLKYNPLFRTLTDFFLIVVAAFKIYIVTNNEAMSCGS